MMSIALPTHFHDATKTNHSTNISNHRRNKSSDRTLTHVNDRQKKTHNHKHRSSEVVAPDVVVHNAIDTKEDEDVAPFDAKTILPESKALKSISQLLESMKKSESRSLLTFECIDGTSRTYPPTATPHDVNQSTVIASSTSTRQLEPPQPPNLEMSATRTGFRAFGIEAYPTRALKNELCFNFISRRCYKANHCPGIHPYDKKLYLRQAIEEQKRRKELRATQAPGARPVSAPIQNAEPTMATAPTNSASLQPAIPQTQPAILQAQPATTNKTASRRQREAPNSNLDKNRASVVGPTGTLQQQRPVRPAENKNHKVSVSVPGDAVQNNTLHGEGSNSNLDKNRAFVVGPSGIHQQRRPAENKNHKASMSVSGDAVHNGDTSHGLHSKPDNRLSDTSSISEDMSVPGIHRESSWDPDAGCRDAFTDKRGSSDSDVTTDDMQTILEGRRIPHSVPQSQSCTTNGAKVPPVKEQKHPRPKINDRCRKWLRNECNLGYQCKFVHEDLEYDDTPEPERYLESFSTTLHDHIKLKLRAGFDVEDIITGFESPWIFMNNLPRKVSDNMLFKLLRPFGEVLEIRRPQTPPLTVKVHFANPPDAYRAFTSLHGKTEFGCQLDLRMGLDLDNKGTVIKDSCVHINWTAPHRTWYAGFESEAVAEKALRVMQNTPYDDFLPTGTLHTALPSVSVATVKMRFLPVDVEEQGLNIFGPIQGLMSERSSYNGYTVQDTIDGVRNMLSRFRSRMVDFEVRAPPYREAKMRAWAYFKTPADAKAAAEHLHCRKPQFTNYTRIYARHIKTITFMVSVVKYRRAATSIQSLAESIWNQNAGNSLSVLDKNSHYCLKLCGGDLKVLGRLKAEVEKILNGEVVLKDGKTAWDDFFKRSLGNVFLQDLERAHAGVSIEVDYNRRKIRLFGVAEKRLMVREEILEKLKQLRMQKSCFIPLEGPLFAAFVNGELASLREKLGSEYIILDFGGHALRLRGDEKAFNVAKDAVELIRKRLKIRRNRRAIAVECPVCFDEVSLSSVPIKMPCGHSWCRTCFHNYLVAASEQKFFPLTCLGNEGKCTERISLYAAKEVLSAADFDATVSAAFDTYVQTHPEELHYCPTPDCTQVFRPAPEGIFLQCPSCLVRICPTCNADAHDGLTCAESKDDDSFKEWTAQRDVKRCPGCNIAIEKDEGCNHMKCTVCQTHICWMCMKTFPGGNGIYGHMQSEHGGFGLGPMV